MSKERQIGEITKLINTPCNDRPHDNCYEYGCLKCQAGLIYDAGYRKQSEGEWISQTEHASFCSKCGAIRNIETQEFWNFCPHCGAKMKGGAE